MIGRNTLSLAIECRRLPARASQSAIVLAKLPMPPSLNNLVERSAARACTTSGVYRDWVETAGRLVRSQRPQRLRGPVAVTLTFERGRTRANIGGFVKAPIDLLVVLGLIESSDTHIVRRVVLQLGSVEGMQINVQAADGVGND